MRKHQLIYILILFFINNSHAQFTPSLYAGWGLGTNIGGEMGIGCELRYRMVSANLAVGSWLGEFPEHTGAQSRFDYDGGIKLYAPIGVFVGLNYGIIGESLYTKDGQSILHFEKVHGFSYTLGYRHTIYKRIYGLGFFGFTSNKRENYLYLFGKKDFIPRLGQVVGYELNPK